MCTKRARHQSEKPKAACLPGDAETAFNVLRSTILNCTFCLRTTATPRERQRAGETALPLLLDVLKGTGKGDANVLHGSTMKVPEK